MFTYYSISALINFLFSLLASVFLMISSKKDVKNDITFAFSRFAFFVIFWSAFYFLWQISTEYDNALIYSKFLISFAAFIPIERYSVEKYKIRNLRDLFDEQIINNEMDEITNFGKSKDLYKLKVGAFRHIGKSGHSTGMQKPKRAFKNIR